MSKIHLWQFANTQKQACVKTQVKAYCQFSQPKKQKQVKHEKSSFAELAQVNYPPISFAVGG